ncbi:MAG: divalent-cation tolerance protein CutA [Acidiferrobacterales bacterium]
MNKSSHQIVLCTCPDPETATKIAKVLVDDGLAACVNIQPSVASVYRWQGKTETATESLMIIKSLAENYSQIEKKIVELHPYELPEVIAVPIVAGLKPYLAWLSCPEKVL